MKINNDYSNLEYYKIQSLKKFDEDIMSDSLKSNIGAKAEEDHVILDILQKQKIAQEEQIHNFKDAFNVLQNVKKSMSDSPYKAVLSQFNLTPKSLASLN